MTEQDALAHLTFFFSNPQQARGPSHQSSPNIFFSDTTTDDTTTPPQIFFTMMKRTARPVISRSRGAAATSTQRQETCLPSADGFSATSTFTTQAQALCKTTAAADLAIILPPSFSLAEPCPPRLLLLLQSMQSMPRGVFSIEDINALDSWLINCGIAF